MKKLVYIFLACLCLSKYSNAQSNGTDMGLQKDLFFVGYEISIPSNNDYLTRTSWSGARFEYRRMILPNVSVGAAVSYNSFNQYFDKQTYQRADGTGAVTSDMIRRVYTSPITINTHYYMNGDKIKPYLGMGLGAQFSDQSAYFNIYDITETNWGFVVRPEFGVLGKFGPSVSGFLSFAYNYSTNSNDDFNIKHFSHFPITVGLVFTP